jgi:hypothetical protein
VVVAPGDIVADNAADDRADCGASDGVVSLLLRTGLIRRRWRAAFVASEGCRRECERADDNAHGNQGTHPTLLIFQMSTTRTLM